MHQLLTSACGIVNYCCSKLKNTLSTNSTYKAIGVLLCFFLLNQAHSQNPIVLENQKTGNPASEWDISGAGDLSIQGFATDISVNKGERISFKIKTNASAYTIDIYRLGYYQGNGARKVGTGQITASLPQNQPNELSNTTTGLIDCGNWNVSGHWDVPADAVSGIYIARLRRNDNGGASHIVFIVRDDAGTSDLLFQTADATWQAYNAYGGNSLYVGNTSFPSGHAAKVSYNRPFLTRSGGGGGGASEDWLFNAEYPMIRWLERNGYDVSYFTNVDADRKGDLIKRHKVFLSVGHDEYWSGQARANVEAARDAGVHLAFFSGNEVYWKTRWEPSIDGSNSAYRTLVCYKEGSQGENTCGGKCDPLTNVWTGLWRDGCQFQGADGCRPENELTGQISWGLNTTSIVVPSTFRSHRFWRNTTIAQLTSGSATLSPGTLGYEFDYEQDNGKYPAGRVTLSQTNVNGTVHKLSLYRHPSGALVFGAGTVQWSWGLDNVHDRGASVQDVRMQQATLNIFADMGVQPQTRQLNLAAPTAVNDVQPPASVISSPANGAQIATGTAVTISGTATESGGGVVVGVEISTDGGVTWIPVLGTTSWSYTWTPTTAGTYNIRSRAWDDMGNLERTATATNAIQVTITGGSQPPTTFPAPAPIPGAGGPILVITSEANPFTKFYYEILRAEGFNTFENRDIGQINETVLQAFDVVILGEVPLNDVQANYLRNWAESGGTLIGMRPSAKLGSLFGITPTGNTLADSYLLVNTSTEQGKGIVGQTIQYHGVADLYTIEGASVIATLYSNATTSTSNPAVTYRSVGTSGGQAIAFTYDLARSIVYTRQGNPSWSGQDRDGLTPIRSNDLYFGQASFDRQADWVDLNKVAIPQADEQQHLLANIITKRSAGKKPLPRFWFLPRGLKAAVVMTGDDHANGGTIARFQQYTSLSTSNTASAVANWNAIRGSSYIYPNTPITNTQVNTFQANGFEIGLHINTNCANYTATTWQNLFNTQLQDFKTRYPAASTITTNRTHCIAWSDWATQAKLQATNGIRLDVNYYYWPGSWVQNRAGMFTGSGMPMRFADVDGTIIDCYQVTTQMTDESDQAFPEFFDQLLDKALGQEGYYGVFCANMHTDANFSAGSDAIINSAIARGVPVISARQLLTWLDSRNSATISNFAWSNNELGFSITASQTALGLETMLPMDNGTNRLKTLRFNGASLAFRTETIKGIDYAFFTAQTGTYMAIYDVNTCGTLNATLVAAPADCDNKAIALKLSTASGTAPYTVVVNNVTYTGVTVNQAFATLPAEQSIWPNTAEPSEPDNNDGQSIEVGVKFRANQNGLIYGIRFFKGSQNTGTHTGSLWTATGTRLASAVFVNETGSGWQEVRFTTPVTITANTTYIASYLSPGGGYAANGAYFLGDFSNGSLTALRSGLDGSNGLYQYGGGFPTQTFNASNYWVDVLFRPQSYTFNLTSLSDAAQCARTGAISSATLNQSDFQAGQQTYYRDQDGDGYGNALQTLLTCTPQAGYVTNSSDCNDDDKDIYPGAPELCDGKDNNCNGTTDEGVTNTFYRDADGDGYGVAGNTETGCAAPTGYVALSGDCNDGNPSIKPGAADICDGIDNDCDGTVDEDCTTTIYYRDADGDTFGNANESITASTPQAGYVTNSSDCNDDDKDIYPGAPELCDGKDNNCNGTTDEGVTNTFYRDADGDGYGTNTLPTVACSAPSGFVAQGGDCNDNSNAANPGATEVCDGIDNDCDGLIDEGLTKTFYRDGDGDGYGIATNTVQACTAPTGYVALSGDCSDINPSINPGITETCDGIDNNCNSTTDEGVTTIFYRDADGDTYGTNAITAQACAAPSGFVTRGGDCNDASASVNPGAPEICDGMDNNCNGSIDETCLLNINSVTVYESEGIATLSVTLASPSTRTVRVDFATQNGTAGNRDFTATRGTLTFTPGTATATQQTIRVSITRDNLTEPNETFTVRLSRAVNARIGTGVGTVTIINGTKPASIAANISRNMSIKESTSLDIQATPNPSSGAFTLQLRSSSDLPATIQVVDAAGRTLEARRGVAANGSYTLGQRWMPGVYIIQVTQGTQKKTLRLVKAPR